MNIFYIHPDPVIAAEMHCDKHVVKMILESAQLLSTAHRVLDGYEIGEKSKTGRNVRRWILSDDRESILYHATHLNHPSCAWARQNSGNYTWLARLFRSLNEEYTRRYHRVHKCRGMLNELLSLPINIKIGGQTTMPQCMPDHYKDPSDSVLAYRNYYLGDKARFAKWTNRNTPDWWKLNTVVNGE